ncbi:enoyl-CoA hydratase-related protein [Pseudomonas typographi]|uniref:enoyl-CoA hydratase-related protein n=1 Tax=Pseudomonas typographi TaxID=2715964 RepID=UPI00168867F4|nr:enoyl-CoA hydratase-related protein [Pseudomonas typographi]MBD1587505.1 crotonase [Pseudomonas typographi]
MADIEFYKDGHVAFVRLNRPKSLNAISDTMDQSLHAAWHEINSDPDIWVAVLSAEGERAFCVGADVTAGAERTSRMALAGGLTGIGGPLVTLTKPLIAAVQGYVLGGGFELAMCADIIIAADSAVFAVPETKAGIIGECGVLHRAVRQLPQRVAMAMILTGDRLPAEDALKYGLVNEVVPFSELEAATARWAAKVLQASPLANQAAKQAAIHGLTLSLNAALGTRYEPIEAYAGSGDRLEGRLAFQEKRLPQWTGR